MRKFLPALVATLAVASACGRADRTAEITPPPQPRGEDRVAAAPPPAAAAAPTAQGPRIAADALTDTVITGKVKAEILNDPAMAGADVSVNTDKGVVVLAGTVKSQEQTAIASAHAQRQDGVMRVDNHLTSNLH